jgi:Sulfotransferase domain
MTAESDVVDFVGIGAPKSGTKWLWARLREHPDLFLPDEKELYYFNVESHDDPAIRNPNVDKPIGWYRAFFTTARPTQLTGEISPVYLSSRTAPEGLHRVAPVAKLFVILRNPVERTFSDYLYRTQRGTIPLMSFEEAITRDPSIVERSAYAEQLRRWLTVFSRDCLHIMLFDDLQTDAGELIRSLYRFLGVSDEVREVEGDPINVSGIARHPRVNRAIATTRTMLKRRGLERVVDAGRAVGLDRLAARVRARVEPFRPGERPTIDPGTARRLRESFELDIAYVEELTERDLSSWRAGDR